MIIVFKTNCNKVVGDSIVRMLSQYTHVRKVNFDFEDCDTILRVDATKNITVQISSLVKGTGYQCEELHE